MWHRAKKVTLSAGQIEVKIDFPLPIIACNLMFEYTDFYENLQVNCAHCSSCLIALGQLFKEGRQMCVTMRYRKFVTTAKETADCMLNCYKPSSSNKKKKKILVLSYFLLFILIITLSFLAEASLHGVRCKRL